MMMNKKGQMEGVGILIAVALAVIVGAILMQASAQNTGQVRNTVAIVNDSFAAANNTNYYLSGYKACSSVVIWNNTADVLIGAGNYTVTNNVVHDGAVEVRIAVNYSSAVYAGDGWNISCTAQPDTYSDSAGRAVSGLIIVFMALALLAVVMYPIYKGPLASMLGK